MEELEFATDRPIFSDDEDLLDRAAFSRALANAIASWRNQESLVIGLSGNWGCGKSSVKNLAVQHLIHANQCQLIEFNPWEWAGQESLNTAFFEDISRTISRKDKSKEGKKLAKALRRYGRRLTTGMDFVDGIAKSLVIALATVSTAVTSFASELVLKVFATTVMITSWVTVFSPQLRKLGSSFTDHAKSVEDQAKDDEATLSEVRETIQELLSKRERPLLIVLDDLDRLSADQMRAMFQLVKANMAFPNVVFLMLYQRDVVEKGLQRAGFEGSDYLEKIIQVPFSVPVMSSLRLEGVLHNRLEAVLAVETQLLHRFDKDYWHTMFTQGLKPFFSNLRNVYRYTSTLAFHCRLLRGTEVAEVNAVDLFALECLRVFSPETYAAMPRYKELLTDSNPISRKDKTQEELVLQTINMLAALAPERHQAGTLQVIKLMFPTLDWALVDPLNRRRYSPAKWLADSRVCRAEIFDRYFEFSLPQHDVPNSLLAELESRIGKRKLFCELFGAQEPERQREILNRLEGRVEEFPLEESEAVICTLLQVGELVDKSGSSLMTLSTPALVYAVLHHFLLRHERKEIRSRLLRGAFRQVKGFVIMNILLANEDNLRQRDNVSELDFQGFEALKREFSSALLEKANAEPDAFLMHWNLISYLYRLNRFSNQAGTLWAKENIDSSQRFLAFVKAAVSISTQSDGVKVTQSKYVSIKVLEDLLGISECKAWLSQLSLDGLTDPEREAVLLVKDALQRFDDGDRLDFE